MSELPFEPYDDSLRKILLEQYMLPAARWLLGKSQTSMLAQESNSHWESAISIMYLSGIKEILTELKREKGFRTEIATKCAIAGRWLLDKAKATQDGLLCWDYVTWDTSVVVRALLLCTKLYETKFSKAEIEQIVESTKDAMKWLYKRFSVWEPAVKYPFGPSDVAQILITALLIENEFKEIAKELNDPSLEHKNQSVIKEIAEYLLHIKEILRFPSATGEGIEEVVWWGDFYQTAEILESLSVLYKYYEEHDPRNPILREIEDTFTKVFRYLETHQSDGRWGTHVDTMRVVYAIVKVSRVVPDLVTPEPHLVFKALRWICDQKQRFEDGSFLHTMFLTIFMCEAFLQIYKNWSLSEKTVAEIYDDCLWAMPARTTPERAMRFATELKKRDLAQQLNRVSEEKSELTRNIEIRNKNISRLWLGFSLFVITVFLFFLLGTAWGIISISVIDKSNFIELIGAMLAIFGGVFIFIEFIRKS